MGTINRFIAMLTHSLLLCGALLLCCGSVLAAPNVDDARLPLFLGDYLLVEYIDLLRKTRSPIAAGRYADKSAGLTQHIDILLDTNKKLLYLRQGNFHEGGIAYEADTSLKHIREFSRFEFEKSTAKIKVISRSEFLLVAEGKVLRYRHVGNFRHFLNRETIAGRYKDEQGRLYVFSEDGWADFPQERFQYQVDYDYVMSAHDNFYDPTGKTETHSYGFKLQNDTLQLFELGGPMGDVPEPDPFVTLRRVND